MWCAVCGMDHVVEPTRLCATCLALALAGNEQDALASEDSIVVIEFAPDDDEHTCPTCELRKQFASNYPDGCFIN